MEFTIELGCVCTMVTYIIHFEHGRQVSDTGLMSGQSWQIQCNDITSVELNFNCA